VPSTATPSAYTPGTSVVEVPPSSGVRSRPAEALKYALVESMASASALNAPGATAARVTTAPPSSGTA